ncbi:MAG: hypothetical protein A2887_03900 [Alphaproteobacteria bacterium RIFCSPLOWO2_01_FULL_40_26]|nr:MAG: hypothetical protein A3D15_05055 [Alphaproteobacteria bacterium RIFCSPHIGHO2_02_FULL_40_34]OFW87990.1 MAG: hypothetical protein A2794_00800 [Alphaproteobacteria bacterium RIFCSPHIGHO2_01_FULL_40_8]OFW95341.1 MAG: hypothetical protein A2887_03900 [Alphaproteobacteria bacterium RIFCSPLOWO2_01_FULL_40_26]OFX09244.1 MAG: hypothetical protein A3H30_06605 [Alphaproteobacteria bacterium RIFCSPLOWO2_02_FULL_40_19]OFX11600.1 MAG: hypothetical protein A3G22_05215 [Alphaproteobacteria bacterium RI
MKTKPAIQENIDLNELSKEALQIIDILDRIENHTIELRRKIMEELKQSADSSRTHLKLDNV